MFQYKPSLMMLRSSSVTSGESKDLPPPTATETLECNGCKRNFKTRRRFSQHQRLCTAVSLQDDRPSTSELELKEPNEHLINSTIFKSAEVDEKEFIERLQQIHEKAAYWKRNLFLLPSGKAGRSFIDEIASLLKNWIAGAAFDNTAFKAVMVVPRLLSHKPSKNSKAKEHLIALERRMKL